MFPEEGGAPAIPGDRGRGACPSKSPRVRREPAPGRSRPTFRADRYPLSGKEAPAGTMKNNTIFIILMNISNTRFLVHNQIREAPDRGSSRCVLPLRRSPAPGGDAGIDGPGVSPRHRPPANFGEDPGPGSRPSGEGTSREAHRKTPLLRNIGRLNAERQYSGARRCSFAGLSCKIITKPIKRI